MSTRPKDLKNKAFMAGNSTYTKKYLGSAYLFYVLIALELIGVAVFAYFVNGYSHYFFTFGYIGCSIALGISLMFVLPRKHKEWGRKISQLLIGGFILIYWGLIRHENMQLEMFFFYLFSGLYSGAVVVYLAAHIIGPLIYGRSYCGWSCWTAMILDLLPYDNPKGRIKKWGGARYLHFLVSFLLVFTLWAVYRVTFKVEGTWQEFYWMLGGNALYFALSIGMAFALKDNRAFCKYACPIPTVQKIGAPYSLFKIKIHEETCIECGLCEKACPMDINLLDYKRSGERVLSTECVSAFSCINVCPTDAIEYSFGFDGKRKEALEFVSAKHKEPPQ